MGFMDKVKAQAEQALAAAQQGVTQGQEKLDSFQTKRSADGLLRELGAAFYAEQRTGGSVEAVKTALAALDRHGSEHGPVDTSPAGEAPADATASGSSASAPSAPAAPPAQAFNPPPSFNQPPSFNPPPSYDQPQ